MNPNLAIFRIPVEYVNLENFDSPVSVILVEMEIDDLGVVASEGTIFGAAENDTYNQITFNQVVLAQKTEGGSFDLGVWAIDDIKIHECDHIELQFIVGKLLSDLEAKPNTTH